MIGGYTRHREPGWRSGRKKGCLWAVWSHLVLIGNGCGCGRDSWRGGFLFAHPRTIRRDRKGWSWESIGPVDTDREGRCLRAWGSDQSGWWDRGAYVTAWEDFRLCRYNTYPSSARAQWWSRQWWRQGQGQGTFERADGRRRRMDRGGSANAWWERGGGRR